MNHPFFWIIAIPVSAIAAFAVLARLLGGKVKADTRDDDEARWWFSIK